MTTIYIPTIDHDQAIEFIRAAKRAWRKTHGFVIRDQVEQLIINHYCSIAETRFTKHNDKIQFDNEVATIKQIIPELYQEVLG